jgi:hypothetical protein
MDTITIVLIIVLLVVLGIFAFTQISPGGTTGRVTGGNAPQYYGGGGCGR